MSTNKKNTRIYQKSMNYRFHDCSFSRHHLPDEVIMLLSAFARYANWSEHDSREIEVYGFDLERNMVLIRISHFSSSVYVLVGQKIFSSLPDFCKILTCNPRRKSNLKSMRPDEVVAWAERKIAQTNWLITH